MKLAGIEVGGHSIGGLKTCIDLPEWKLCFDIGRCPDFAIQRRTVLFTHSHIDHMGGVVSHAGARALQGMSPPRYVVPREDVDAFEAMFDAWRKLDRSDLPHETIGIGPGDEWRLGKNLVARAFRSPHRAPCQGYALLRERTKLKPEFEGLEPHEIGRLKTEEGVEVQETVHEPWVTFTGDTRIEVVDNEELVRKARLLIMEATFLDERVSVEKSRFSGHVHLDEWIERAERFENEAILLTHFSARYKPSDVRAILDRRLPAGLRERVTALLPTRGPSAS